MTQPITFATLIESLPAPFKKVYQDITTQWTTLGHTVQQWTNKHLAPEAARKAQDIFQGLPHTAVILMTPPTILVPTLAVYYIVHVFFGPLTQCTLNDIWNGFAVGAACVAGMQALWLLTSLNPLYLISAFVYGYVAKFFLSQGTLIT